MPGCRGPRPVARSAGSPNARCNPASYLSKGVIHKRKALPMSQREISLAQLTATRPSSAVVPIRFYVGLIFVGEGMLKFLRPESLGSGRFVKAGIPAGAFFANLDGVAEIICGVMIL